MNFSQYTGILRIIVPAGITYAIGKGWITQDMVTQILGVLGTIAAAGGWSAVANTNLNLSKAVASVPGLTVHVDETAPPEMQKAAVDRNVADIVPAAPLPTFNPQRQG